MAIGNMRNPTLNQLRLAWYQKVNHNGIPKRAESKKYIDGYFARGVVVNVAPTLVVTLTGTGTVGSAITAAVSGLGTPPAVPTYQWQKNGSNIVGATTNSYTPVTGDIGATINCRVSATNVAGTDAKTAGTGVLISAGPTAPSITVVITGNAPIGSVLTAVPTIIAGNPTPTFTYQWKRGGANISGATSVNYTTVSGDIASAITVTVVATNGSGTDTKTSSNSIVVTQAPTITVAITGSTPSGSVLTATPTLVSGSPAPSYAYAWQKNGTPIGGETAATYTTVVGDVGATINCSVTATNSAGADTKLGGSGITVTGGSVPTGLVVTISPTHQESGKTYTANASATGATSYTYKWQDNGVDISGATSQTFTSDGTWGTDKLNCLVTPVNANGSGTPGSAASNALMRWAGYIGLDGSGTTTAKSLDSLRVMNGQAYWLIDAGTTPNGNVTIEGNGPAPIATHPYIKVVTNYAGMGIYAWGVATADQVFDWLLNSNWGGAVKWVFKTVGYSLTPVGLGMSGNTANNSTPLTVNLNVPSGACLIATSYRYDVLANPSGIQHYSGTTFQKTTAASFQVGGVGYVNAADASLDVLFSLASGTIANKIGGILVLTPNTA